MPHSHHPENQVPPHTTKETLSFFAHPRKSKKKNITFKKKKEEEEEGKEEFSENLSPETKYQQEGIRQHVIPKSAYELRVCGIFFKVDSISARSTP